MITSGAPWARKFGYDVAYARSLARPYEPALCKLMSNVPLEIGNLTISSCVSVRMSRY